MWVHFWKGTFINYIRTLFVQNYIASSKHKSVDLWGSLCTPNCLVFNTRLCLSKAWCKIQFEIIHGVLFYFLDPALSQVALNMWEGGCKYSALAIILMDQKPIKIATIQVIMLYYKLTSFDKTTFSNCRLTGRDKASKKLKVDILHSCK